MSPRKASHPDSLDKNAKTGSRTSQDKDRHLEEAKHHPGEHQQVHAPHHPQEKAPLPPRHHPHTHPPEYALDIDHGTHEDRPRPGKIAKKSNKTGFKR